MRDHSRSMDAGIRATRRMNDHRMTSDSGQRDFECQLNAGNALLLGLPATIAVSVIINTDGIAHGLTPQWKRPLFIAASGLASSPDGSADAHQHPLRFGFLIFLAISYHFFEQVASGHLVAHFHIGARQIQTRGVFIGSRQEGELLIK